MRKHFTILTMILSAIAIAGIISTSAAAPDWAINAQYTETCSCNVACPCVFGSPATHPYCNGNNLIQITKGHYGDVNLDGISVVTAFSLGKWLKIYIDENATDEQAEAVLKLLKQEQTFGFIYAGKSKILSQEKAAITVEKTPTLVKFSVPNSSVEIELMKGRDGKAIKIQNLPVPFLNDYTQYKSVNNSHKSEDKEFKYSGTNGLTSTIDVSS